MKTFSRLRNSPKRGLALVALGPVLFVLGSVAKSDQETTEPPPNPVIVETGTLQLSVPNRVAAGATFVIEIDGATPDRELFVTIEAGYGTRHIEAMPAGSSRTITVDPFEGPASGLALITVVQGRLSVTEALEIEPGAPVDPIDVYLGPRTVIADAQHFIMAVAVPEDRWGNPVADGTFAEFTTTRPDQVTEGEQHPTEDLLAWYEIFSGTLAGRTRVATRSVNAGAGERDFLEVADHPNRYELQLVDPLLPADGQALLTIRTDLLADRYGNVMPDGTAVFLDAKGVTGTRRINGQTVDGHGEFTLQVPDRPGEVTLIASASGVQSEPLNLTFATAVHSFTAEVEARKDETLVHVGPVRSVRQSFVPEGTIALVTTPDGISASADLSLGIGTARLPVGIDPRAVTVEVLGTRVRAKVQR